MDSPLMVGVAGGSGSGKTTVVRELVRGVQPVPVSILHHDSYYRDFGDLSEEERLRINFDHPDSLETSLLIGHLKELMAERTVQVPVYDFVNHARLDETREVKPTRVVILDGLLILADAELRSLLDIKVYVDTDADVRFIRRMQRDMQERERSLESVVRQYQGTVRPMHLEFVEPSKRYADVIVPQGGHNRVAVDMLVAKLRATLVGA